MTRSLTSRHFSWTTLAGVLCLCAPHSSWATDPGPTVTNGGYMETKAADTSVPLPLKHTDVQAEVAGIVASVKVTQEFHNPYDKPIEAIYVFPLPHRAAIYEMTIQVGQRTIQGVVKKREEAKAIYEQAKAQGKTAALLEQERPNIFTQSIANILPKDRILVTLRYVEDLEPEAGHYEFVFPMVVGPRYVGGGEAINQRSGSGWGTDTDRIPDASRITPKLLRQGLRPGNDISVQLSINGGRAVHDLKVLAHKAAVQTQGAVTRVQLDARDSIPNKDFVVRYRLTGQEPEVVLLPQRDARDGHFLLMIQPKAQMRSQDIAPREYVFVVDTSGSMGGFPLNQAKAVVDRCLDSVRPQDTFQLIQFAGGASQLAPRALPATAANIKLARQTINNWSGGGGTEFIPALSLALKAGKDPARSRIVLFITDGYIGYEAEVLRYLRESAKGINVFALGIGSSVNRFLIDGMARVGLGSPFYLLNTEKPSTVVNKIYATISRPALTRIEIDWGGLAVKDLTPAALPDLFGERPVFVAGRYSQGGTAEIKVHGLLAGRPFTRRLQVSLPDQPSAKNQAVAYLWARRQIAEQMDIRATESSQQQATEQRVTTLALRYNLISQFTSFVAVDSVIRNQGGQQVSVPVPVALPSGVSPMAAPVHAYTSGSTLSRAAMGYGGYGKGIAGPMSRRRSRRPSFAPTPVAEPAKTEEAKADELSVDRSAPRISCRLQGSVQVQGQGTAAHFQPLVQRLVARLGRSLGSISHVQPGRYQIQLTIDPSGRVSQVVINPAPAIHPASQRSAELMRRLERLLKRWRFAKQSGPSMLSFSLTVS